MCRLHIEFLINSSDYLKWWSLITKCILFLLRFCICFCINREHFLALKWYTNVWMKWKITYQKNLQQQQKRFFHYLESSSSFVFEERIWFEIIISQRFVWQSCSIHSILEWLLFKHPLFTHIIQSWICRVFLFGGILVYQIKFEGM